MQLVGQRGDQFWVELDEKERAKAPVDHLVIGVGRKEVFVGPDNSVAMEHTWSRPSARRATVELVLDCSSRYFLIETQGAGGDQDPWCMRAFERGVTAACQKRLSGRLKRPSASIPAIHYHLGA